MDTTKENYTEYYKKYKALISYTNMTRKKFAKEYRKLFDEEIKKKEFYLLILSELKKAVSEGKLDSLKRLDNFIGYINDIEGKSTLKDFYDSEENPMKNSNLVILACKYNKVQILKYIFSNSEIINKLTLDIGRNAIALNDQDEECHNAFYYSVRSNNVELLDTLINEWPGDYFATHLEELDEVLSAAYEELKLKNVPLSHKIQVYTEDKLTDLRFFSENSTTSKVLNNNPENVKKRIELVLENISLLKTEYPNTKQVDEKFLFVLKFIAQNIHILKRQLKSTYDKIPWEEIEFCLVSFVSSYMKQHELNLFYRVVLNKRKLLNYLESFAEILSNEKEPKMFTHLPIRKRQEIVAEIINNYPQFEELYNDYQQIRDICSLQKMNDYVKMALSIDPKERQGRLVITRILQVVGEHLKNTLESPRLSDVANELLLLSLPRNTRKIIMNLRNSLSHGDSLARRIEIEKSVNVKFYIRLQNDIKKIGDNINNILHKEKMKVIRMLLEKVINCQNLNEIKEVAEAFVNTSQELDIIEEEFQTMESNELGILIEELNNSIIEKTEHEQKVLHRIQHIINELKNKWKNTNSEYLTGFRFLRNFTQRFSNRKIDNNDVKIIKSYAKSLKDIMVPTQSCDFEEIVDLLASILYSMQFKIANHNFDNVRSIIYKMICIIKVDISNVKWIEGLRTKLNEKPFISVCKQNKDSKIRKEEYDSKLKLKLHELQDILTNNKLISNLIEKLSFYRSNKRLQSVIEMLVLDIMSILDYSTDRLENNSLFLDDNFPLLTGKCLRNHLAHDNNLTNILLLDPSLNIILNAKKLVSENIMENKKKLGKPTKDDYLKVRNKYNQDVIAVINQQGMFAALEEGRLGDVQSFLRKGADIRARNSNLWTALHFAAKGQNLKIVKFVLSHDLDINVKSVDGQSPLHVAAANGRANIVKYFVEERVFDVNETDNYEKTPLHIAAQNNHKDTVEVLLKNGSNVDMCDIACFMPLHYAIQNNCTDIVKILMEQLADFNIDKGTHCGITVLHVAAEFGYLELVNLFLRKKANVSVRDEFKRTPLHFAAAYGHLKVVTALISNGADINIRNMRGYTPLHCTIENGHEAIANVLLEYGADPKANDNVYKTAPLHVAAKYGRKEIVSYLLEHKPNANVTSAEGLTPLHCAAQRGHLEVVNILIDHGVDVHAKDKVNGTALYHAASEGHKEIVELLLKKKADPNVRTLNGLTPLHAAIENNQKEVADFLIQNKAEVNATDNNGRTPLHAAAASPRNKDVIELMIRYKAIVNITDNYGMTPLHTAAHYGCIDNALLLIKNEANVNAITTDWTSSHLVTQRERGHKDFITFPANHNVDVNMISFARTPLDMAICACHKEIVEILLKNGAIINENNEMSRPLSTAVRYNQKEIVKLLIENGVNVRSEGSEALATAVSNGYTEIVEILLENEVPINEKYNDDTFLHLAAARGHEEIVNVLISHGANVNAIAKYNMTPLHLAAHEGYSEVVETLITSGANVNAQSEGGTPLHLAAANGHFNVVQILLDNKARIDVKDAQNRTALELAVAQGCLKVVKVFFLRKKMDVNTRHCYGPLLHIASQQPNLEMVKYLVDEGADINVQGVCLAKPVHVAATEGHKNIVEYFLSKGMNVNEVDGCNNTLLHWAIMQCQLEVVKYLIGQGADVNVKNDLNQSPLHVAVAANCKDITEVLLKSSAMYNAVDYSHKYPSDYTKDEYIAELLTVTGRLFEAVKRNDVFNVEKYIKAGTVVNAKDAKDVTPLHYAAWKGYDRIAGILLESAANPNVISKGSTPLHYAVKFSHFKIVKLLLSKAAMYNAVTSTGKTPLDLATDKNIIDLFQLINKSFEKVESDNVEVINDLNGINDVDMIRAVMNARNEKNESLIIAATHSNFMNIDRLKEVSQGDISDQISRSLRLLQEGNWDIALKFFREALEKRRTILGPDNPATLNIQTLIAEALRKQGMYQEALEMLEEIFRKQNEMLGSRTKDTLRTKGMIALVLYHLSRYEEAYSIYQDVYQEQKEILGPNHPETLNIQSNMVTVLTELGRYDEALDINRAVFEKWKSTLGVNNPQTLHAQHNIAIVLASQGKLKEALKIFEEVLNKKKLIFGTNHPDTLFTLANIAKINLNQNRYQKALKHYQELLNIQEIVLGPNHPDTLTTHYSISVILFKQGKCISALKVARKIVPRIKNIFPPTHPTFLGTFKIVEECNSMLKLIDSDISYLIPKMNTAANDGDIQTVQYLLEDEIDVNDVDTEGRSPLHYAASKGHLNVVNLLLNRGADVDASTGKGNTPLHLATSNGHKKIVDILLQHVNRDKLKNFINAKTIATGTAALHVAAKNGFLDIVYCLLGHGAIYNIENKKGETPSDLSKLQDIVDLLKMIEELFIYAENGNNEIIRKLKDIKKFSSNQFVAVTNARNERAYTLLQVSAINRRNNVANKLLKLVK